MAWGAAVLASLLAVVLSVVFFCVAAAATARRRSRPDPLATELDTALEEILERPGAGSAPGAGRFGLP